MRKQVIIIIGSVILFMITDRVCLADSALDPEVQKYLHDEVERIYTEEGGKRPKNLVEKEVIKRGMLRGINSILQKQIDSGDLASARHQVDLYHSQIENSPSYTGVGTLREEALTMTLAGMMEEKSGKPNDAIRYFERAKNIYPNAFWANYELGAIYWSSGKCSLAYTNYKKAIEIDSDLFWSETPVGQWVTDEQKKITGISRGQIFEETFKKDCGKNKGGK